MTTEAPGARHDLATPAAREPVLQVIDADLGYGELQVVFGVSLPVGEGELVGLVGGNGSGKSPILRAVSGMIRPWRGRIVLRGEDVGGLRRTSSPSAASRMRWAGSSYDMTVEEPQPRRLPPARQAGGFEARLRALTDLW